METVQRRLIKLPLLRGTIPGIGIREFSSPSLDHNMNKGKYSITQHLKDPPPIPRMTVADWIKLRSAILMLSQLKLPLCIGLVRILSGGQEMAVKDLVREANWLLNKDHDQPKVSDHLGMLRRHGVVTMRVEGLHHYYKLDRPRIISINNALARFLRPGSEDASGKSARTV